MTALQKHVPELDGIRGLAILMVFVGHVALFGSKYAESTGPFAEFLARNNGLGVDLFFVLSGFLITGILYDAKGSQNYFRNFYARRTLRIFPLYYATLALVAILKLDFPDVFALHALTPTAQLANWTYTSNILIASRDWGAEPGYLGHFWSLAVEEQFYLLWPIVVLKLNGRRLIQVCLAGIVGAFVARMLLLDYSYAAAYTLLPARMDSLLLGAMIALSLRMKTEMPRWTAGPSFLVAAVGLVLVGALEFGEPAPSWSTAVLASHFSITSVAFAMLLLSIVTRAKLHGGGLFGHAWLRFFGRYSYAIYVFHLAVLIFLQPLVKRISLATVGRPLTLPIVVYGLVGLAITTGAALVSWQILEQPFLRLKDRFSRPPDEVINSIAG